MGGKEATQQSCSYHHATHLGLLQASLELKGAGSEGRNLAASNSDAGFSSGGRLLRLDLRTEGARASYAMRRQKRRATNHVLTYAASVAFASSARRSVKRAASSLLRTASPSMRCAALASDLDTRSASSRSTQRDL